MANPSVTYTFTNGTTADGTQVSQNFTDLINGLTDGTKSLNIDAITAAGTATFNGAVNLGNATGDAITVNGAFAGTGGDASGTQRGLVTTAAQSFAGVKTFTNGISLGNETLGVYDEGTWTPAYQTSNADQNVTYTTQTGYYTRIGRVVFFSWQITLNAVSSVGTGNVQIGGLPFDLGTNLNRYNIQTYGVDVDASAISMFAYPTAAGTKTMQILYSYDNNVWAIASVSSFVVAAGDILAGSGWYFA